MTEKLLLAVALALFYTVDVATATAITAPAVAGNPKFLGSLTAPGFPAFRCDGGSGGFVNGYNLVTLSDPRIGVNNSIPSVHTGYAYFGVLNDTDPTEITIIADYKAGQFHRVGTGGVIMDNPRDSCHGSDFAPGPFGRMISIPRNSTGGLNVWTVYDDAVTQYNTMIEFDVRGPSELNKANENFPAQRVVDKLFHAHEPQYGSAGLITTDGYLYLFAVDKCGIKMARVWMPARTDRTRYEYYNADEDTWGQTPHSLNGTRGNILKMEDNNIFGFDVFWNKYYKNFLMTYEDGLGPLSLLYSTTGKVEGPYNHSLALNMTLDPKATPGLVYLGHAHPGWDETGKSLLYSWSSNNQFLNFGLATFQ